ncbi:glycosyltransferase [Pantoea latae]|uniref:Glycosyl transferase n=1 Tax=Pantoea latae TaxID=1964541 RepID=A0A1V9DND0_9GAMM|nr:glycosyltransferase [Pantoea latae]OQP35358.1 glycosyl transferase [Pantoea latae]
MYDEISVVIPTFNRCALLENTLRALTRQTIKKDRFEVIVVDDGGRDDTAALCQRFSEQLNIRYYWQNDNGFRAGKARNIGVAAAEGRYIVFIDAGVLLQQDALARHLQLHRHSTAPVACIGYVWGFEAPEALTQNLNAFGNGEDVRAAIAQCRECHAVDIRQKQYDEFGYNISAWPAPFDIFWTCHVSAEKEALLKAGLFDEAFNGWGGEDVDLGVRLFLQNNRFVVDPDICSLHVPHKKLVADHKGESENAGKKIHAKYQLWQTAFYGCDLGESKFSLNKVIALYADQSRRENHAFIRKHLYRSGE